jgi:hypothetical protein
MIVDGTWNVIIATPIGKQSVVLEIATHEGRLSGTATQGQERVPFLDPRIDGGRLTWNQDVTKPLRLNVKFEVDVAGDAMTGTAKAGVFPAAKLTGARAIAQ